MRAFMSYGIALVIIVIIAVWMSTGTLVIGGSGPGEGEKPIISVFEDNGGHAATESGASDPNSPALSIAERNALQTKADGELPSVRVKSFTAQPMPLDVTLRGTTEANATISAVAETSGVVENVAVSKGDRVETGDLLCELDRGTREAAVAQAEAAVQQAQVAFDSNQSLRQKGLAPANSGSAAEASLKAAQAALKQARAELDRTQIHAKVAGVVQEPIANLGTMLNPGGVCATIVQLDPIVFVGSIPEARIGLARTGLPVTVTTVNGAKAEGKVSFISAVADPATRTFKVEVDVPNPDHKIRDGVTAEATVNLGTMPAHLLPQSVLTLDDGGELGVRAVKDSKVVFYPVTIISDTRDGVWVSGLPAQLDVITLGQENVKAGQEVVAGTMDEGAAS